MSGLNRNVPLLALCAALAQSITTMIAATAALVGSSLAEDKALSTLPVALMYAATMCTSIPAGMLMQRIGRKAAFLWATLSGVAGSALATFAIVRHSFWLFVLATICIGIFGSFANFYRFTAADTVAAPYKSKAVALVMVGGVVAAIAGPALARLARDSLQSAEFAGAYLIAILLYVSILFILSFLRLDSPMPESNQARAAQDEATRPLSVIVGQQKYLIALVCALFGYGVMTLVMTATPLSMQGHAFHFDATATVIQWHVLAMYAPSFLTGSLIARYGVATVMSTGALFGLGALGIHLTGESYGHYLSGLILLGLSWNFLFVGGTTLLTETYTPAEKNKAQAFNDFIVFTAVALASLSAGALQSQLGWRVVNFGAVPLLIAALAGSLWLVVLNRRAVPEHVGEQHEEEHRNHQQHSFRKSL